MINAKYIVPNGITVLNIISGSCAVIFAMEGYEWWMPVICLLAAAFFDLLDGLTAKLLKATSEFGKQLDSIADVVSFGLAPAILMYQLLFMVFVNQGNGTFILEESSWGQRLILFSSLNLVVFAALRLARFNSAKEVSSDFIGLPVPASALFVVAIWIVVHGDISIALLDSILNFYFIIGVIALISFLMISNIPMLSLKFEGLSLSVNLWRYILIIGAFILYLIFGMPSLIYIMVFYVVLSLIKIPFSK